MNKARIALLSLFFFILCLALTFFLANQYLPSSQTTTVNAQAPLQQNLILIQVDDLSAAKPRLVSIWLLFYYHAEPASLSFMPLYPGPLGPQEKPWNEIFALTPEKELAPGFISALKAYDFPWEGFILLDNTSLQRLGQWLAGKDFPMIAANANPPDAVLQGGQKMITSICAHLGPNTSHPNTEFPWHEIFPSHARTDLLFEMVTSNWSRLNNAGSAPKCKVLPQRK